jgi:hypothetical protein
MHITDNRSEYKVRIKVFVLKLQTVNKHYKQNLLFTEHYTIFHNKETKKYISRRVITLFSHPVKYRGPKNIT